MTLGPCLGPKGEVCECLRYDEDQDEKPPRCRECWHGRSLHCLPQLTQVAPLTKASVQTKDESKAESGSESESEAEAVNIPLSSSLTITKNRKIVADLRSSLLANAATYESAKNETLHTFHRKQVSAHAQFDSCHARLFTRLSEVGPYQTSNHLSLWVYGTCYIICIL
jgi:hypothetical protein